MMSQVIFKIMGGFVLFLAAGLLLAGTLALAGYLPRLSPSVSAQVFGVRLIIVVGLFAILGIGLLGLRKWAALTISILALYPAFWSVWDTFHPAHSTTGEAKWFGYVYALLLIFPSVATALCWRGLVWRKDSSH